MNIDVYGIGCEKCNIFANRVKKIIQQQKIKAQFEIKKDLKEIRDLGIMNLPALVINDEIVSIGKCLSDKNILKIITQSNKV